jgi:hypothetical protein
MDADRRLRLALSPIAFATVLSMLAAPPFLDTPWFAVRPAQANHCTPPCDSPCVCDCQACVCNCDCDCYACACDCACGFNGPIEL